MARTDRRMVTDTVRRRGMAAAGILGLVAVLGSAVWPDSSGHSGGLENRNVVDTCQSYPYRPAPDAAVDLARTAAMMAELAEKASNTYLHGLGQQEGGGFGFYRSAVAVQEAAVSLKQTDAEMRFNLGYYRYFDAWRGEDTVDTSEVVVARQDLLCAMLLARQSETSDIAERADSLLRIVDAVLEEKRYRPRGSG